MLRKSFDWGNPSASSKKVVDDVRFYGFRY